MLQSVAYHRTAGESPARVAIYRPFFLAGMLSVLTTGCLLGAVALLGISLRGSYTANAWTPAILAHANSQLYGWVGLFVMGFSLQQHPPRASRAQLFHRLAACSLLLIGLAIGLRFVAEPLVSQDRALWLPVGIASGIMQALAVLLFVANIGLTRHRVRDAATGTVVGLPWQSCFVFTALGWWMLVAVAEPFVFALSHQADRMQSVFFIARWFVPYREAQFLGFVVNMIFGVALARLSSDFGASEAYRRIGCAGFGIWNLGLAVRIVGWLWYFDAGMSAGSGRLYSIGGLLLATGALWLVYSSRLFEPLNSALPSHKFLRAAFGWLLLGGLLLLLEPWHLRQIEMPFSHAYTGAIRHALTVGFISQMIVGVALYFVPRLRERDAQAQSPLWTVFWLLNVGNALRVAGEILTDYTPAGFLPMGVTGFIELAALVLWAVYIGRILLLPAPSAKIRHLADASAPRIA